MTIGKSASPRTGTVVRAKDTRKDVTGYLHGPGHLVNAGDAKVFSSRDLARISGRRLGRALGVDPASVELIEMIDGRVDESTRRPVGMTRSEQDMVELAAKLQALPVKDLASVLKVLDERAFDALHEEGLKMSGLRAAHPPRHETGGLDEN